MGDDFIPSLIPSSVIPATPVAVAGLTVITASGVVPSGIFPSVISATRIPSPIISPRIRLAASIQSIFSRIRIRIRSIRAPQN